MLIKAPLHNNTFAIVSGKGGTGKTFISASIGGWLAYLGFRVLLVDMDISTCGLTNFLRRHNYDNKKFCLTDYFTGKIYRNEEIEHDEINVDQLLSLQARAKTSRKSTGKLFLLKSSNTASKEGLSGDDTELSQAGDLANRLTFAIKYLDDIGEYDYVIIDTQGGGDSTCVAAALAADAYVIITETDEPSIVATLKMQNDIRKKSDSPRPLGFIVNKCIFKDKISVTRVIESLEDDRDFGCDHAASIGLSRDVVLKFQVSKTPLKDPEFSHIAEPIFNVIDNIFSDDNWKKNKYGDSLKAHDDESRLARKRNENSIFNVRSEVLFLSAVCAFLVVLIFMLHLVNITYNITQSLWYIDIPLHVTLPLALGVVSLRAFWVIAWHYYYKGK